MPENAFLVYSSHLGVEGELKHFIERQYFVFVWMSLFQKKKDTLLIIKESARSRAFLAHVPYAPTCLRAFVPQVTMRLRASCLKLLRAYVPAYLKLLSVYVPTCLKLLRVYVPYVLMCLYIFFVPTCLRALSDFVPACAYCSCAYVPTATQKIYWGSLLVLLFFLWIIWPFIQFKTPKQTPDSETSYPSPIL